ncbi:DUF3737 family protein [Lactobacillus sp. DCY120]|uniref:DUF3737 family protein n=1 Tax=Bombilactobacillus apium TaxID=2675299 RepID=A0A850QWD9_9LACO|nr:DUF3737 family protein [Bombilactobacillus apium]NVY96114.1 DUF3737 family protein [Bombilactobacillus apium]
MTTVKDAYYEGERSLFAQEKMKIVSTIFGPGESPLKESRQIELENSIFQWKYPLWYSQHIKVSQTIFETMARSGIWYTQDLQMEDCTLQAPKLFRRCQDVRLKRVYFADATETFWTCNHLRLEDVEVKGDYFGKDSQNIYLDHVSLVGNYCFDGSQNVEVHHSTFVSKDAFWNCQNVTIYDSTLNGEYLAWNTKNLTLVNCTIISDQGLCYSDQVTLKNCRLLKTTLAFEYCTNLAAEVTTTIESVKNPTSGFIEATGIKTLILDATKVDPQQTRITTKTPIAERRKQ